MDRAHVSHTHTCPLFNLPCEVIENVAACWHGVHSCEYNTTSHISFKPPNLPSCELYVLSREHSGYIARNCASSCGAYVNVGHAAICAQPRDYRLYQNTLTVSKGFLIVVNVL